MYTRKINITEIIGGWKIQKKSRRTEFVFKSEKVLNIVEEFVRR